MADWNNPTSGSNYLTFVTEVKDRDVNAGTLFSDNLAAATNIPTGAIRYNRAGDKFQEWNGAAWVDEILSLAAGGTGAATAAGARTNLGLGTMATQAASAVAITGGTITGVSITATSLTMAGNIVPDADGTRNIGATATQWNNGWFKNGFKLPVGVDKWITA